MSRSVSRRSAGEEDDDDQHPQGTQVLEFEGELKTLLTPADIDFLENAITEESTIVVPNKRAHVESAMVLRDALESALTRVPLRFGTSALQVALSALPASEMEEENATLVRELYESVCLDSGRKVSEQGLAKFTRHTQHLLTHSALAGADMMHGRAMDSLQVRRSRRAEAQAELSLIRASVGDAAAAGAGDDVEGELDESDVEDTDVEASEAEEDAQPRSRRSSNRSSTRRLTVVHRRTSGVSTRRRSLVAGVLSLSDCGLGPTALHVLNNFLIDQGIPVSEIRASKNPFGDHGAFALAATIKGHRVDVEAWKRLCSQWGRHTPDRRESRSSAGSPLSPRSPRSPGSSRPTSARGSGSSRPPSRRTSQTSMVSSRSPSRRASRTSMGSAAHSHRNSGNSKRSSKRGSSSSKFTIRSSGTTEVGTGDMRPMVLKLDESAPVPPLSPRRRGASLSRQRSRRLADSGLTVKTDSSHLSSPPICAELTSPKTAPLSRGASSSRLNAPSPRSARGHRNEVIEDRLFHHFAETNLAEPPTGDALTNVEHVDLRGTGLGPKGMVYIVRALMDLDVTELVSLSLSSLPGQPENVMGVDGAEAIALLLRSSPYDLYTPMDGEDESFERDDGVDEVAEFTLSDGGDAESALRNMLTNSSQAGLRVLSGGDSTALSASTGAPEGGDGDDATPKERGVVQELFLGNVGHMGFSVLAKKGLSVNTSLRLLDLRGNHMEDKDFAAVCSALVSSRVETLNLSRNGFESRGGAALCKLIQNCDTLRSLDLSHSGRSLDKSFLAQLGPALSHSSSLEHLSLDRSEMRFVATELGVALCCSTSLRSVSLKRCDLSNARPIARWVGTSTTLERLDLSRNMLGDTAATLFESLGENTASQLTFLRLCHNGIGDDGGVALGNLLAQSTSLHTVLVSHNMLGDRAAKSICVGLDAMQSILDLRFSDNRFSSAANARLEYLLALLNRRIRAAVLSRLHAEYRQLFDQRPQVLETIEATRHKLDDARAELKRTEEELVETEEKSLQAQHEAHMQLRRTEQEQQVQRALCRQDRAEHEARISALGSKFALAKQSHHRQETMLADQRQEVLDLVRLLHDRLRKLRKQRELIYDMYEDLEDELAEETKQLATRKEWVNVSLKRLEEEKHRIRHEYRDGMELYLDKCIRAVRDREAGEEVDEEEPLANVLGRRFETQRFALAQGVTREQWRTEWRVRAAKARRLDAEQTGFVMDEFVKWFFEDEQQGGEAPVAVPVVPVAVEPRPSLEAPPEQADMPSLLKMSKETREVEHVALEVRLAQQNVPSGNRVDPDMTAAELRQLLEKAGAHTRWVEEEEGEEEEEEEEREGPLRMYMWLTSTASVAVAREKRRSKPRRTVLRSTARVEQDANAPLQHALPAVLQHFGLSGEDVAHVTYVDTSMEMVEEEPPPVRVDVESVKSAPSVKSTPSATSTPKSTESATRRIAPKRPAFGSSAPAHTTFVFNADDYGGGSGYSDNERSLTPRARRRPNPALALNRSHSDGDGSSGQTPRSPRSGTRSPRSGTRSPRSGTRSPRFRGRNVAGQTDDALDVLSGSELQSPASRRRQRGRPGKSSRAEDLGEDPTQDLTELLGGVSEADRQWVEERRRRGRSNSIVTVEDTGTGERKVLSPVPDGWRMEAQVVQHERSNAVGPSAPLDMRPAAELDVDTVDGWRGSGVASGREERRGSQAEARKEVVRQKQAPKVAPAGLAVDSFVFNTRAKGKSLLSMLGGGGAEESDGEVEEVAAEQAELDEAGLTATARLRNRISRTLDGMQHVEPGVTPRGHPLLTGRPGDWSETVSRLLRDEVARKVQERAAASGMYVPLGGVGGSGGVGHVAGRSDDGSGGVGRVAGRSDDGRSGVGRNNAGSATVGSSTGRAAGPNDVGHTPKPPPNRNGSVRARRRKTKRNARQLRGKEKKREKADATKVAMPLGVFGQARRDRSVRDEVVDITEDRFMIIENHRSGLYGDREREERERARLLEGAAVLGPDAPFQHLPHRKVDEHGRLLVRAYGSSVYYVDPRSSVGKAWRVRSADPPLDRSMTRLPPIGAAGADVVKEEVVVAERLVPRAPLPRLGRTTMTPRKLKQARELRRQIAEVARREALPEVDVPWVDMDLRNVQVTIENPDRRD